MTLTEDDLGACNLLRLPSALIGNLWPAERMVLGMRVSRTVRGELLHHCRSVHLENRCFANVNEEDYRTTFKKVSGKVVILKWQGRLASLAKAASSGLARNLQKMHLRPANAWGIIHLDVVHDFARNSQVLALIDLKHCMIGAVGAEKLADTLRYCPSLTHLDIGFNNLRAQGMARIADALVECKALRHLDLEHNDLESGGVGALAKCIGKYPALSHLELSHNMIGTQGAKKLAETLGACVSLEYLGIRRNNVHGGVIFDGAPSCRNLTKLDCKNNTMGDSWSQDGGERLEAMLRDCPLLSHLNLKNNSVCVEALSRLAAALPQCQALVHLDLSENLLGDAGATALAAALTQKHRLTYLDVSCSGIFSKGALPLLEALGQCSSLQHLVFTKHKFDADSPQALTSLGNCTSLTHLDVSCSGLREEAASLLVGSLCGCTKLAHLNLAANELGSARKLAEALRACSRLTHLNLDDNRLNGEGFTNVARALSRSLRTLKLSQSRRITLHDCHPGVAGIGRLAAALVECQHLSHLELVRNKIADAAATKLAAGLARCAALEDLSLADNEIGPEGAASLAEGLEWCSALEALDLSKNKIQDRGVRVLAERLGACRELRVLSLSHNDIHEAGVISLWEALTSWVSLRRLDLSHNPIVLCSRSIDICGVLQQSRAMRHLELGDAGLGPYGLQHQYRFS